VRRAGPDRTVPVTVTPVSTVTSVGAGLDVLFALATRPGGATAASVAAQLGRDRSQVSRRLRSFTEAGFTDRDPVSLDYRISARLAVLASQAAAVRLERAGRAVAGQLAEDLDVVARVAVLRGDASVTLAEAYPQRTTQITSWLGRSFPAYSSESGQALLLDAGLDELREVFTDRPWVQQSPTTPASVEELHAAIVLARARGYAVMDQTAGPGRFAVAAPVRDFRGGIVAALFVSTGQDRHDVTARTEEVGRVVVAAASSLSRSLGGPDAGPAALPGVDRPGPPPVA
jgi:IclR family transcriptional regulator, pca regulon regulatory protein